MQMLAWGRVHLRYFDNDTKPLDRQISVASIWRGAAVALAAGILAGIFTVTELMHSVPP